MAGPKFGRKNAMVAEMRDLPVAGDFFALAITANL